MNDGRLADRKYLDPLPPSRLAFAAGFFFALRAAVVLFFVRVLGTEPRTGAAVEVASEFVLLALVCFHSLGSGRGGFSRTLHVSVARWVLAYLFFSGLSLLWSGAVSLPASAAYWCEVAADVAIVLVILNGRDREIARSILRGYIVCSCCLAIAAWMLPAQADLRLGDPDYFNTNQIANLCAYSILFAQYLMRRNREKWGFAALFLAVTLVRTLSKTTLAAFLICEAVLLIQDRSMRRRTKVLLTTGAILAVLAFWGLFEAYYEVYTTTGNQAETLTGRTAIWAWSLDAALQKPWFGSGFDSMWKVMPPLGSDQYEARHAENELLQQFYAYGVAGVILLVGVYGSLWARIRRSKDQPASPVFLAIMMFVVIRGLAVAEPFDLLLPLWAIILMSALLNLEDNSPSLPTHLSSRLYRFHLGRIY